MKLIWRQGGIPELPADAPEKPESVLFLWAGIAGAAGGSVFFNVYHDTHSLKSVVLGVIAGFLPPFMAATAIHGVKITQETWVKVCVFALTIGAMVVSAQGAAQVLGPAYRSWFGYLFMFVIDGIDIVLLYALTEHYKKITAYRKWVKAWLAGQGANVAGTGSPQQLPVPVPAPAPARHQLAPAAGTGLPVPAGGTGSAGAMAPAPAVPALPAPGTGAASGARHQAAGEQPASRQSAASRSRRAADPELCERVVREFAAAHPRPGAESTDRRRIRAEKFLAEFRARTGERANNNELGKALGVHPKRDVPEIRAGITEPAGERSEDRQEGIA